MNSKVIVVATEKDVPVIQDFLEIARRAGCHIQWLESWDRAPAKSVAIFTQRDKGQWAKTAQRCIMLKASFAQCDFQELTERVRKVLFPEEMTKTRADGPPVMPKQSGSMERIRREEI